MALTPKQAKFDLRGVFKGAGQSELKRIPAQKTAYQRMPSIVYKFITNPREHGPSPALSSWPTLLL